MGGKDTSGPFRLLYHIVQKSRRPGEVENERGRLFEGSKARS